jgi:hypothetical protein
MKIFLAILLVLVPLTGCRSEDRQPGGFSVKQENNQPKSEIWDFGAIKKGDFASHDFKVKNNSKRTLTIKNVTTSCGCTASAAKKSVLAPGESTQVSVRFNSKGYNGPVSQFVYVNTDDPVNPILKFTIKASVK